MSYADKLIDLGPSLKISYKTGKIDTNSYNGFASDISFYDKFNNDELIGTAKTLKIESQKNKEGQVIINLFSISDIFALSVKEKILWNQLSKMFWTLAAALHPTD